MSGAKKRIWRHVGNILDESRVEREVSNYKNQGYEVKVRFTPLGYYAVWIREPIGFSLMLGRQS